MANTLLLESAIKIPHKIAIKAIAVKALKKSVNINLLPIFVTLLFNFITNPPHRFN